MFSFPHSKRSMCSEPGILGLQGCAVALPQEGKQEGGGSGGELPE